VSSSVRLARGGSVAYDEPEAPGPQRAHGAPPRSVHRGVTAKVSLRPSRARRSASRRGITGGPVGVETPAPTRRGRGRGSRPAASARPAVSSMRCAPVSGPHRPPARRGRAHDGVERRASTTRGDGGTGGARCGGRGSAVDGRGVNVRGAPRRGASTAAREREQRGGGRRPGAAGFTAAEVELAELVGEETPTVVEFACCW
jgi:hypothetical protein